jgi:hypothetical protein
MSSCSRPSNLIVTVPDVRGYARAYPTVVQWQGAELHLVLVRPTQQDWWEWRNPIIPYRVQSPTWRRSSCRRCGTI